MALELLRFLGKQRAPGELRHVDAEEVSLVDSAANRKRLLLYKSADGLPRPLSDLSDAELLELHKAAHGFALIDPPDAAGERPNMSTSTEVVKAAQAAVKREGGLQEAVANALLDGEALTAAVNIACDVGKADELEALLTPKQWAAQQIWATHHGGSADVYSVAKARVAREEHAELEKAAGGSAWEAIKTAASALIAKSSKPMTREEAMVAVVTVDPSLYEAYAAERRAEGGR